MTPDGHLTLYDCGTLRSALNTLAVIIHHRWTPEQRRKYERASGLLDRVEKACAKREATHEA